MLETLSKPFVGVVQSTGGDVYSPERVQRVAEMADLEFPLEGQSLLVELARRAVLPPACCCKAYTDQTERDTPPVAVAPEESRTLVMQPLSVTHPSTEIRCVGETMQGPGEPEVVGRLAKDCHRPSKQTTLVRTVGGTVSEPARLVAFSESFIPSYPDHVGRLRPDNDKALIETLYAGLSSLDLMAPS